MSSGLTAEKIERWIMDVIDPLEELQTVTSGGVSKMQTRLHYTVVMHRFFTKMTSFKESIRDTRRGFDMDTGPKSRVAFSSTDKKYRCTRDTPRILDLITGYGRQDQTWEHFTDWEDLEDGAFV